MKTLLSWSSGKDAAWALHLLRKRPDVELVGLLTTSNEVHNRVAMHAVRQELVQAQARMVDLPLIDVPLPDPCDHDEYAQRMAGVMRQAQSEGVEAVAFGDNTTVR